MLILGHVGFTLGTAVLLNRALAKGNPFGLSGELELSPKMSPARNHPFRHVEVWLTSLGKHVDIRLLLIGSLLPDIIDKPLGLFFFKETFDTGRLFCHTLLFLILITLASYYLYRSRGKTWLFALSFGIFTHLIFDEMWLVPETLLWPLYGFTFVKSGITHRMARILYALLTDPAVYVPEIFGAVILIVFIVMLVRRKRFSVFVRNGEL